MKIMPATVNLVSYLGVNEVIDLRGEPNVVTFLTSINSVL